MELKIPGYGEFTIQNVLLDLNGTLTIDGVVPDEVKVRLGKLKQFLRVVILSADTRGNLETLASELGVEFFKLNGDETATQKLELLKEMGSTRTIAVGNGQNDVLMLTEAAIGIAVIGPEGASAKALAAADVVAPGITFALDCILNPLRLVATLRH